MELSNQMIPMINPVNKTITLPSGRTITIETGKLVRQANGTTTVTTGPIVLLIAVTATKDAKPDVDFMSLQVEYKEKFSAIDRFPGGFARREGRTSDYEILTYRLVDHTLRPLPPDDYHAEVYVNIILFSSDNVDMPDVLTGLAASAALAVFDVPFGGPTSKVRVVRIDGGFVINPTFEQLKRADIDLMVATTSDNTMMVESEMEEVQEEEMLETVEVAHGAIRVQRQTQLELSEVVGRIAKREYPAEEQDEELRERMQRELYDRVYKVAMADTDKHARGDTLAAIVEELKAQFIAEELEEKGMIIDRYYHDMKKAAMRRMTLDEGKRLDSRRTDEIHSIWIETDCLPGPYGSAILTCGETQPLSTVTLDTKSDKKLVNDALNYGKERFLLYYNFPPFPTDEAKASRGVSRRETGHGNLAHRAPRHMIPEDYPYVIHVMSDILEPNGSPSTVTIRVGTLALRDAGTQMKKPVSGTAMDPISENKGTNYATLSDVLGDEDHLDDMDFKAAGTRGDITTTQMNIEVDGLSYEILAKALTQAKAGRLYILDKIEEAQPEVRPNMKPHAPRIETLRIGKEFIGAVIDPGGRVIQGTQEKSGVTVSIEEVDSYGIVEISSSNKESLDAALAMVHDIATTPEVSEVYEDTISSVMSYGCFIQSTSSEDGLLRISEIDQKRFATIEETGFKEGDAIDVKLIEVGPKTGKFSLSYGVLLPKPEGYVEPECRPRREHRNGGERRERRPRHGRHDDQAIETKAVVLPYITLQQN